MTESIGWISLYGNSPSINFFQDSGVDPAEDDRDLNVLLSEVGDIRHIMKSLSDVLPTLRGPKEKTINIDMTPRATGRSDAIMDADASAGAKRAQRRRRKQPAASDDEDIITVQEKVGNESHRLSCTQHAVWAQQKREA